MNFLGLMAMAAAVFVTYRIAIECGFPTLAARWAIAFLAFGGGVSTLQRGLALLIHHRLTNGIDVSYLDLLGHSTFMVYPYHSVALALLALMMLFSLRAIRGSRPALLAAIGLALLLSWVHPYEVVLPLLALGIWSAASLIAQPREHAHRRRLVQTILLGLATAPAVLYGAYIGRLPVWSTFSRLSLNLPVSTREWCVGYGIMLLLALVGGYTILRDHKRGASDVATPWLAWWLGCFLLLFVVLQLPITKICDGFSIPLSLLAGAGAAMLWTRAAQHSSASSSPPLAKWAMALLLIVPFTTPIGLIYVYRAIAHGVGIPATTFDADIVRLLGDPRSAPTNLTVLCDANAGAYLPSLYGYRVYAGHWSMTPDVVAKCIALADAGFIPDGPVPAPLDSEPVAATTQPSQPSAANFANLIGQYAWDRVLVRKETPAEAFAREAPRLRLLAETSRWMLFAPASH